MSALSPAADAALTGVLVLATAVWVGGLVAIFVVARVATATLPPPERVAFFRGLGRAYGPVGGLSLTVALVAGAAQTAGHPWDGLLTSAAVVAGGLVVVTLAGVVQARRMTRLRRSALQRPGDELLSRRVRRGALGAAVLRAVIAALSLTLIALGALLAT